MKEWLIRFTDRPLVAIVLSILSLALCFIVGLAVVSTVLDLYQEAHKAEPPHPSIVSVVHHGQCALELAECEPGHLDVWVVDRLLVVSCLEGHATTLHIIQLQEGQ